MKGEKVMKTKFMKLIIAAVVLMAGVFIFSGKEFISAGSSVVYAAPDDKKDDKTTESGNGDGETINEDAVKDINDMSVTMDSNGKMTTSFDGQSDSSKTWNTIFKKYRIAIVGIAGILTLTFIVLFLINFFKVGAASDNPVERRKALIGVLWTGLAAAGSGSVTLICALFWNALK